MSTYRSASGYNEHATISPDATHIAWMHGDDVNTGTEWWLSATDGSGAEVISMLNVPGGAEMTAADLSWHSSGDRFVGFAHSLGGGGPVVERIYLVTLR